MECLNHLKSRGAAALGCPVARRATPARVRRMSETREFAERIIRTLREYGHQAFLVGGCVRDLLLAIEPADYDVTTDATPDEVMRIFPETYAVGAQFGVVLVPLKDDANHTVEVATFRSDIGYSDGRHPDQVRFSREPQEDVAAPRLHHQRSAARSRQQEVLDYVGGRKDLEAGIIRAIGDPERRFSEDKLRMLRAVRFAARFGYAIESSTFAAIQELAAGIQSSLARAGSR